MLRATTILLCLSVSGAPAAQVFKCVKQGKTTYSDAPCQGAQVTRLELPPAAQPPSQADPQAELQRQAALADKLASARRAREARDERQRANAARAAYSRAQRCQKLRLQAQWAAEDARGTRDSDQVLSLRKKAARAAESLRVECPG